MEWAKPQQRDEGKGAGPNLGGKGPLSGEAAHGRWIWHFETAPPRFQKIIYSYLFLSGSARMPCVRQASSRRSGARVRLRWRADPVRARRAQSSPERVPDR